MKWSLRVEHLFYLGFLIVLFRQPLQYGFGSASFAFLGFGVSLCLTSLLINFQRLRLSYKDRLIIGSIFIIFVLHVLLKLIGVSGEANRQLWFSGFVQLLTVILFLHYRRNSSMWVFLKTAFLLVLIVECVLAFLQLSYYSTGVGLKPVFDEYENYSLVSGSFFNSNDFSVFVATFSMALYSCWLLEGKDNRGYFLIGIASVAVFVSLSRTAFFFMSLFAVAVMMRSILTVISTPKNKSRVITLIVLASTFMVAIYLLRTDFLVSTSVFERSIARISQIGEVASDESASTRSLVYLRLLENIQNLWIGTFSDQNYSKFFVSSDYSLMKINPHSFVAEMSFLYGWLGLVAALSLIGFIAIGIMKNREIPILIKLVAVGSLIFFQSVPSSILGNPNFFLPYLMLMYCRKNILTSTNPKNSFNI